MRVQSLGGEDPLEERTGNSLQYSCLENPTDRRTWRATIHKVPKSWPRLKQLSMHAQVGILTSQTSLNFFLNYIHAPKCSVLCFFPTLSTQRCIMQFHLELFIDHSLPSMFTVYFTKPVDCPETLILLWINGFIDRFRVLTISILESVYSVMVDLSEFMSV